MNTYAYARSNPVNFIDPYGLWTLSFDGYYGVGGGVPVSYKNGKLEVLGRVVVKAGIEFGLDLDCGSGVIARTNTTMLVIDTCCLVLICC